MGLTMFVRILPLLLVPLLMAMDCEDPYRELPERAANDLGMPVWPPDGTRIMFTEGGRNT